MGFELLEEVMFRGRKINQPCGLSERPKLKQQLPVDTYADLGKTLTIPCSVTGTPLPYVTWYRNAANINTLDDNRYVMFL